MPTTFANTINGNPIYASRAESDKDGNRIDTTYAKLSDIPTGVIVDQTYDSTSENAQSGVAVAEALSTINQVPASTSADEDKVLTIDSNGYPVWAASQGSTQVQSDWTETNTSDPSYIQNKPSLATVATTGDYDDLDNKPTIPAAQVNSDWNASTGVAQILNKPTLATVATTGDYADLTNKPSIPTKTSDLQNDSGFITSVPVTDVEVDGTSVVNGQGIAEITLPTQVQADWDESDSSEPSYIQNKPTIPAAQVNADWTASSGVAQILNKPSIPSATSELTNDSGYITSSDVPSAQEQADWTESDSSDPAYIKNKPSIPSATSDLTNDSGYITSSDVPAAQEQADWNESDTTDPAYIKNKPSIPAAQVNADWTASSGVAEILHKPSIPSATSDLTNDSGFITSSDVPSAQAQADWDESDSSDPSYIKNKPTIPAAQVNSDWNASSGVAQILNKPSIPTATSDLTNDSGFITSSDIPAQAQANWTETDTSDPSYIQNKPTIPAAQVNSDWTASSGVAEILHKPTIPSATSDLTNDSGFITSSDVPAAQEQSDWNESDTTDPAYIKNKPTIPAAQVNSDWTASSGVAQILNKPTLATVATTGDYADLTNKPTIPSVTVQDVTVNGTSVVSNGTAAVVVPAQVQADWNESDTSDPSYIQNKPTIPAAQVNADWNASSGVAEILNKPTIPPAVTVDQTYNSSSTNPQSGTAVSGALATIKQVPTPTTNDDGKVLAASVNTFFGTSTIQWENRVKSDDVLTISLVNSLPNNPVSTTLYLIPET